MSTPTCPPFSDVHTLLLAHARAPHPPATLAVAGVVAQALSEHGTQWLPLLGLDARTTQRVLHTWFPGADGPLQLNWPQLAPRNEPRYDEVEDIVALLLDHSAAQNPPELAQAVACALASASLGHNHLWQDLHLPSRTELSALLNQWFPTLAARNTQNMKWKKFFYKQLCERADINICKAPTCNVCTDYGVCFGPETAGAGVIPMAVIA